MKYTASYFIRKFSRIKPSRWICGMMKNSITGQCCALGHCSTKPPGTNLPSQRSAIAALFEEHGLSVAKVNDLGDGPYRSFQSFRANVFKQKTPRGRILAALRAIRDGKLSSSGA